MKTPALIPIAGKTDKQQTSQAPLESSRVYPREIFAFGQKPNLFRTIYQAPLGFGPSPSPVSLLALPPHSASFPSIQCFNQTNLIQYKPNQMEPNQTKISQAKPN